MMAQLLFLDPIVHEWVILKFRIKSILKSIKGEFSVFNMWLSEIHSGKCCLDLEELTGAQGTETKWQESFVNSSLESDDIMIFSVIFL